MVHGKGCRVQQASLLLDTVSMTLEQSADSADYEFLDDTSEQNARPILLRSGQSCTTLLCEA